MQVEAVERYQKTPQIDEIRALMSKYGGCAYFYTQPGMYGSIEKLKEKIAFCKEAFQIP